MPAEDNQIYPLGEKLKMLLVCPEAIRMLKRNGTEIRIDMKTPCMSAGPLITARRVETAAKAKVRAHKSANVEPVSKFAPGSLLNLYFAGFGSLKGDISYGKKTSMLLAAVSI
jgi:hypothetical protein